MFALIIFISVLGLTACMLPNAVREREREREREIAGPTVHKPQ